MSSDEKDFDEALSKLEEIVGKLESKTITQDEEDNLINQAGQYRAKCKNILDKQKDDIKRIAANNDIPLSEIGLKDDEDEL